MPPPAILELETEWCDVFPLDKPFSIHDEPFGDEDAWEWGSEEEWLTFLDDHPEAFDSLEVIDDLVTALMQKEQFDSWSQDDVLLKPLLLRAAGIMDLALRDDPSPRLAQAGSKTDKLRKSAITGYINDYRTVQRSQDPLIPVINIFVEADLTAWIQAGSQIKNHYRH